jgi:serine/threonine-protein kinase
LAAYIILEVCRGLDYAHNKLGPEGEPLQIVHRDVSPQNVLITFEGQVKLVDFGIARAASRITSTQVGVVKGKVAYMSPEQLKGAEVDRRSDVFSAGILLYEMLTNRRPFDGETPQETMALIASGTYQAPQKLNHQIDRRLAGLVKKSLEKNAKRRYQTAGKMAADLAALIHKDDQPPTPAALARLIAKRMPEAKPRTLQPTPVQAVSRPPMDTTHQNTGPFARPPEEEILPGPSPSSASFMHAPSHGEVLSFSSLNLGEYDRQRQTDNPAEAPDAEISDQFKAWTLSGDTGKEDLEAGKFDDERPVSLPKKPKSAWLISALVAICMIAVILWIQDPFSKEPVPASAEKTSLLADTPAQKTTKTPHETKRKTPPKHPTKTLSKPKKQAQKTSLKTPPAPVQRPKTTQRPLPAPLKANALPKTKRREPKAGKKPSIKKTRVKTPHKKPTALAAKPGPDKIKQAKPKQPRKPKAATWGVLEINSDPFSVVYLGRRELGETPIKALKLPVGSHSLVLKNEILGITKKIRVRIEAGQPNKVFIDLTR